ncbi:MAG: hypothetical protein HYU67_05325 [Flavobacteriia bacterium]|nr:hypothetical protein [Flavobacteriia bacterium]
MNIEELLILMKKDQLEVINQHPELIKDVEKIAFTVNASLAWRACFLLSHLSLSHKIKTKYQDKILSIFSKINGSHQRECLRMLRNEEIKEENILKVFSYCLDIWKDIHLKGANRLYAFYLADKCVKNYKELKQELYLYTSDYYTDTFTKGLKHSFSLFLRKSNV